MPLYEYRCTRCGARVEALQRVSEPPLVTCGACGGPLERLISAPALQFKGSGWYVTDYAGKGKGQEQGEAKAPASKETAKSEAATPSGGDAPGSAAKGSGRS